MTRNSFEGAVYVVAVVLVLHPTGGEGALSLNLTGYTNIPTDGSGRILITDIGEVNDESLICFTNVPGTSTSSDWYLHPTSQTTDESDRIETTDIRGWIRNRGTTGDGFRLIRLRRDLSAHPSVGGVFTCIIREDTDGPISVGIYHAVSSVAVSIDVVSAREGTFTVTCTSTGGTVLSSSLTGPGGLDLELQPVGTPQYRGQDTYSVTTGTRTGSDGDTYHCTASNGVPAPNGMSPQVPSDSEILRVAGDPTLLSAEQVSPGTTIRVTWSPPSGGATVTGYRVHYRGERDGDVDEGSVNRGTSDTTADILNLMNDGRTYAISVEAQSVQLSGESSAMSVVLAPPSAPTGVSVRDVQSHSVHVQWSAVSSADRYTVSYEQQQGEDQLGLCKSDERTGSVESTGTSVTVEGTAGDGEFRLRAFSTYSVTVRAVSERRGSSGLSDPILFTTAQTAADAPPAMVQAAAVNSTSIRVDWDRITRCRDINGLIVRYHIRYRGLPSGAVETAMVAGVWNLDGETALTGLTPFTNYSIEVAAVNNQSDVGEFSDPVITRTNEDIPGPVSISSSSGFFQITISWEEPAVPNGVIIAYEVAYHPTADPQTVTHVNTTDLATSWTESGLQPGNELTFTVRAYTRVGAGEADTATVSTLTNPPPVQGVTVSTISDTSIRVMWEPLMSIQGATITGYTVFYSQTSGRRKRQDGEMSRDFPADSTSAVIDGLESGATYQFQVSATATVNGRELVGDRSPVTDETRVRVGGGAGADDGAGCDCTTPIIIGVVIAVVGVTVGITGITIAGLVLKRDRAKQVTTSTTTAVIGERGGFGEEKVLTTGDNPAYGVSLRRDAQESCLYEMPALQPPPAQNEVYEKVL